MKLGLEKLDQLTTRSQAWGRCALLCNQASLNQAYVPAWRLFHDFLGERLVAFFGPQHGFEAVVQDNMIETGHQRHLPTGLPVYSLYSEAREPTPAMLANVDTILIDIQIVGCRVYTFKYTIAACLRAAKKLGKRVMVFDRPNPLGGTMVGGRVLEMDATSFVGEFAIPMRHGMSSGEAALLFNQSIGAQLDVITMDAWDPSSYWHELGREWIITSPNLPTIHSTYVYPATVMLEGTNISEGRGTGLPFQFVGAPYIKDAEQFRKRVLDHYAMKDSGGIHLRPTMFQPTSQKWAGQTCLGVQIHVLDPKRIATYRLGLAIIKAARDLGDKDFAWKQPPYEYDFETLPIKLILGSRRSEAELSRDGTLDNPFWHEGEQDFITQLGQVQLYKRQVIRSEAQL